MTTTFLTTMLSTTTSYHFLIQGLRCFIKKELDMKAVLQVFCSGFFFLCRKFLSYKVATSTNFKYSYYSRFVLCLQSFPESREIPLHHFYLGNTKKSIDLHSSNIFDSKIERLRHDKLSQQEFPRSGTLGQLLILRASLSSQVHNRNM